MASQPAAAVESAGKHFQYTKEQLTQKISSSDDSDAHPSDLTVIADNLIKLPEVSTAEAYIADPGESEHGSDNISWSAKPAAVNIVEPSLKVEETEQVPKPKKKKKKNKSKKKAKPSGFEGDTRMPLLE
jgi:hypothetical protein